MIDMFKRTQLERREREALGRKRYFDPIMGGLAGGALGIAVYLTNDHHGVEPALIAAAKQGIYTFTSAGFTSAFSRSIATYFSKKAVALTSAVIVPSAVTFAFNYGVHLIKGTPEPLESTIPTAVFAPLGMIFVSHGQRKKLENILQTREANS